MKVGNARDAVENDTTLENPWANINMPMRVTKYRSVRLGADAVATAIKKTADTNITTMNTIMNTGTVNATITTMND